MPLTFTAISYRGRPPTAPLTAVITPRGGTIGRAPDNDLVLSDPEKVISRVHASIRYENGAFYLTDTSLAGTTISNRGVTLHQHTTQETARLENGDHIQVGDYELTVSVSEKQEPASPPPPIDLVREPFVLGPHPGGAGSQDDLDLERLLYSGKSPGLETYDGSNRIPPESPNVIDYLRGPAHQESFSPPETAPAPTPVSGQDGLPGDFNLQELLSSLEEPADHHEPIDFPDIPPPPGENLSKVAVSAAEPGPPPIAPPPAAPEPPTPASVVMQPVPAQAAIPPGPPPQETPVCPSPTPLPAGNTIRKQAQEELVALFFEAAGIGAQPPISQEDVVELMQVVGVFIREMTGGLMTMLRGRMELKNQFRVSRTVLRTTGNNPLKFSLTAEDALKLLLVEKKSGFLKAIEAVRQACGDIMNHELASTAANQAALLAILKQFNPRNFSQQYEEGFVIQKKSKCWEAYCQAYPELTKNAQDNYFGEDFARAYEEQMQKLQAINRPDRKPV